MSLIYANYYGFFTSSHHPSLRKTAGEEFSDKFSNIIGQQTLLPSIKTNKSTSLILTKPYNDNYKMHIIFSTDCSAYQDWQSIVLFYSARTVKQPSPITRIAR